MLQGADPKALSWHLALVVFFTAFFTVFLVVTFLIAFLTACPKAEFVFVVGQPG